MFMFLYLSQCLSRGLYLKTKVLVSVTECFFLVYMFLCTVYNTVRHTKMDFFAIVVTSQYYDISTCVTGAIGVHVQQPSPFQCFICLYCLTVLHVHIHLCLWETCHFVLNLLSIERVYVYNMRTVFTMFTNLIFVWFSQPQVKSMFR